MTKLSVCIPSVRDDQIDDAISSVLKDLENHDFEYEILVGAVGGFSFDLDDHCHVFETPESLTIVENRNYIYEQSEGEYIGVLDDDDRWVEGRIEKTLPLLENGFELVGSWRHNNIESVGYESKEILEEMCISHSSWMFRNRWKYREKFFLAHDYDLLLRIFSDGYNVGCVDEMLVDRCLDDSFQKGGHDLQSLLSRIARLFYNQRVRYREDNYDLWEIDPWCSFESAEKSLDSNVLNPPPLPVNKKNAVIEFPIQN